MQFTKAAPNESFPVLRFVSETGRWEFGLRAVMFGVRVSVYQPGAGCYTLDYCAADQEAFALELLLTLTLILQGIPESISENDLQRQFPRYAYKPINRDRSWGVLHELAGLGALPSITCPRIGCDRTSYDLDDIEKRYCGSCQAFHDEIPIK